MIISTSRKGLNMVSLVPTTETKTNVQAQRQGYPNNPIRASPKCHCGSGSQELTCVRYLAHPPRFVWLNRNFKKRYDVNPSFRHILQDPRYKKPTFEAAIPCMRKRLNGGSKNRVSLGKS
jgi:hypothetical protein